MKNVSEGITTFILLLLMVIYRKNIHWYNLDLQCSTGSCFIIRRIMKQLSLYVAFRKGFRINETKIELFLIS